MMLVLSGEKGCGKTTLLRDLLTDHHVRAQGFLSVKDILDGVVKGISLITLPEHRVLPMATTTPMMTDVSTGKYYFYPGIFELINRHFQRIRPNLPFIFDEFGPLEMQQKGHYPVFSCLQKHAEHTLVVVRSDLREIFLDKFCVAFPVIQMDLDLEDSGAVRACVLAFLNK